MAKFFLPGAKDDAQAEQVWGSICQFAVRTTNQKPGQRRIQRVVFVHEGKHNEAEVGQPYYGGDRAVEVAIAILECPNIATEDFLYLICTENRGVVRGMPYFVGSRDTHSVVPFDRV